MPVFEPSCIQMEIIDGPELSPTHFTGRSSFILGNWFRRLSAISAGSFTRTPERPPSTVDNSPHLIVDNSALPIIDSSKTTCYWSHMEVLQPIGDLQSSTINGRCQSEMLTSDSIHPPRKGRLSFTVVDYCAVLYNNPEAPHTMIHSVSLWVDAEGIVPHKFLIMHAIRLPGVEYYIRLDRRPGPNQPSIAISSQSDANDEVTLSRELDHLVQVGKPVKELSRIIFPISPTLRDVNMILRAVCESYPHYVLYAENCWWWSSIIQYFLQLQHSGVYVVGPSLIHRGAGNDERIAIRLRELRNNWSR
ncbi:uncharacterized protein EI90DRAFT_3027098 [Cantharellus anzutake]|uniref:uncharacterized protein n=1 Tax=Cantharellus anzutake TaxID=1750568 RepID=UPI001905C026|nr:uncharacterized protein EI90DRAFT_3027098 [Cantharellus anzutake]KAF8343785.1 hypothetical protein EI90DRAFT_3027098 [Cantharellus anzutake]